MKIILELAPDETEVDEFMLAGAIYRLCKNSPEQLDSKTVGAMLIAKCAADKIDLSSHPDAVKTLANQIK